MPTVAFEHDHDMRDGIRIVLVAPGANAGLYAVVDGYADFALGCTVNGKKVPYFSASIGWTQYLCRSPCHGGSNWADGEELASEGTDCWTRLARHDDD
eukprot:COSAG05_NODE_4654_length_1422_cov_2.145125_2_plen_98_part_00